MAPAAALSTRSTPPTTGALLAEQHGTPTIARMRETAGSAIEGGIDFLLAGQGDDGMWRDFLTAAGQASTWPTGYIGNCLQLAGADRNALERTADALVPLQQSDGGWGYNEETPSDADSTSWALLFLARMGGRDRACRRAGLCLARHQRRHSGGVATYAEPGPIRRYMDLGRWVPFRGWCRPHIEVSAVAGRAHCALASDVSHARAGAAWRYVHSRQNADGSWNSYWWTSPHFATQQAVELALSMRDLDPVRRAAAWTLRGQGHDGGWGAPGDVPTSAFATALSLSVLVSAGLDDWRPVARAIDALVRLQQEDGGWPSHPTLRIPFPADPSTAGDDRWRLVRFAPGIVVQDQHRTFTSATCVAALARAKHATG
jgi:squalene cyclase